MTDQHETEAAPKVWRGRFYEDFDVGDAFRAASGGRSPRPTTSGSRCLTMNTNQMHFNTPYTERHTVRAAARQQRLHARARHRADRSRTRARTPRANLAWTDIKLPKPVFVGDTLWAESEITDKRESKSNPNVGIVSMRCRGINQRARGRDRVQAHLHGLQARRPKRSTDMFPATDEDWTV